MTELDKLFTEYLDIREELAELAPDLDPELIDQVAEIVVENL